jgi:hypothetical protein
MKRFYKEFIYWEDYLNGMYSTENSDCADKINLSYLLLTNQNLFLRTCIKVVEDWKISTKVNLTNKNSNRQAWLGQSACSYLYKCTELQTRQAWAKMTDKQRYDANLIADKIINNFELNYENKNQKLHL